MKVVQEIEISETGAKVKSEELQLMTNQLYRLFPPLNRLFLEAPLCDELQASFQARKSDRGCIAESPKSVFFAMALVANQSKSLSNEIISSSN